MYATAGKIRILFRDRIFVRLEALMVADDLSFVLSFILNKQSCVPRYELSLEEVRMYHGVCVCMYTVMSSADL